MSALDPIVADPRVVIYHIGDVTCVLMVPDGCPTPHVDLTIYTTSTTPDERATAVRTLDLAGTLTSEREGTQWRHRETERWRATVFLRAGDEHAQVAA